MFNGIYKFDVLWRNELCSKVTLNKDNSVSLVKYTNDIIKQPFYGGDMSIYRITEFFEGRCYQRNYAGIEDVKKAFGLEEYNAWEMIKVNHGLMRDDCLWIRINDELLSWENVCMNIS